MNAKKYNKMKVTKNSLKLSEKIVNTILEEGGSIVYENILVNTILRVFEILEISLKSDKMIKNLSSIL